MTAAAEPEPSRTRPPFADASPAEVRTALIPEEAAEFDRQWRDVMARATQQLDLSEVLETLESWRRVAWLTITNGPEGTAGCGRASTSGYGPASGIPAPCRGTS
jgi:hypothetical protein